MQFKKEIFMKKNLILAFVFLITSCRTLSPVFESPEMTGIKSGLLNLPETINGFKKTDVLVINEQPYGYALNYKETTDGFNSVATITMHTPFTEIEGIEEIKKETFTEGVPEDMFTHTITIVSLIRVYRNSFEYLGKEPQQITIANIPITKSSFKYRLSSGLIGLSTVYTASRQDNYIMNLRITCFVAAGKACEERRDAFLKKLITNHKCELGLSCLSTH